MKKALKYLSVIILFLLCIKSHAQEWELQKKDGNIEVYFRKSDKTTYEIRVKATYNTKQEELVRIIGDYHNYPNWVYRCSEAEIIQGPGNTKYVRTVTDVPWPLKDRDVIVRVHPSKRIKNVIILTSDSTPDAVPTRDNIVRQRYSKVIWKIKRLDSNRSFVDYTLTLKVKEEIPEFMMKMITTNGPHETFKNLNKILAG